VTWTTSNNSPIDFHFHRQVINAEDRYLKREISGQKLLRISSHYFDSYHVHEPEEDLQPGEMIDIIDRIENQEDEEHENANADFPEQGEFPDSDDEHPHPLILANQAALAQLQNVDICMVCMAEIHEKYVISPCGHCGCKACLQRVEREMGTCPQCRQQMAYVHRVHSPARKTRAELLQDEEEEERRLRAMLSRNSDSGKFNLIQYETQVL